VLVRSRLIGVQELVVQAFLCPRREGTTSSCTPISRDRTSTNASRSASRQVSVAIFRSTAHGVRERWTSEALMKKSTRSCRPSKASGGAASSRIGQRLRVTRRMPYRLPLELEFTILELAAPPLAFDDGDRTDARSVSTRQPPRAAWPCVHSPLDLEPVYLRIPLCRDNASE
jgi:hypothetical protein